MFLIPMPKLRWAEEACFTGEWQFKSKVLHKSKVKMDSADV